jgi:predicted anti-sigma-YlaC factor YlaD
MIACARAESLIEARLDGAASPEEDRLLDAHLVICPACASLLEEEHAVDAALAARFGAVEAPPSLAVRVRARVDVERPSAAAARPWLVDALNAAGMMVALGAAGALATVGGVVGAALSLIALAAGAYPLLLAALADAGSDDASPADAARLVTRPR